MAVSGSPESDIGSFECFQNYTAPEVFVQGLAGQINQQDVEAIIRAQKQMLQRFEKTNEMLSNCNSLAYSRFSLAQKELKKHTTLMHDMKKDLDNIFKRIRNLKIKISSQHPTAFAEAQVDVLKAVDELDGEEEVIATGTSASLSKSSNTSSIKSQEETGEQVRTAEPKESGGGNTKSTAEDEHSEMNNSSSCDSMSSEKISSSSSFDN